MRSLVGKVCVALTLVLVFALAGAVQAEEKYPSGPVEIIVPWSAGGATDVLFRALGTVFPKYANGQQLIVKNVPGGGAAIGYTQALSSRPDGYTIVAAATPMIAKINMSKVSFTATSFAPIMMIADNACMIMVPADSPYKDLRDFVADAKKRPLAISVGNGGSGGGTHLAALAFERFAKVKFTHVPFEGGGPSITAALGKHVDSIMVSAPEGIPQALAGQLRILGVFGSARLDRFPKVLTAREQGMDFTITMWRGLLAPIATPDAIVRQLHDIFKKCMDDPEFKKKADELSVELKYMGAKDFGRFMVSEDTLYRELCQEEKLGDRWK